MSATTHVFQFPRVTEIRPTPPPAPVAASPR